MFQWHGPVCWECSNFLSVSPQISRCCQWFLGRLHINRYPYLHPNHSCNCYCSSYSYCCHYHYHVYCYSMLFLILIHYQMFNASTTSPNLEADYIIFMNHPLLSLYSNFYPWFHEKILDYPYIMIHVYIYILCVYIYR